MSLNATIRRTTLTEILSNKSGVTYRDLENGFRVNSGWLPVKKTDLIYLDDLSTEYLQQIAEDKFNVCGFITMFWSPEIQKAVLEELSAVPELYSRLNTILATLEPEDFLFIDFE